MEETDAAARTCSSLGWRSGEVAREAQAELKAAPLLVVAEPAVPSHLRLRSSLLSASLAHSHGPSSCLLVCRVLLLSIRCARRWGCARTVKSQRQPGAQQRGAAERAHRQTDTAGHWQEAYYIQVGSVGWLDGRKEVTGRGSKRAAAATDAMRKRAQSTRQSSTRAPAGSAAAASAVAAPEEQAGSKGQGRGEKLC